MNTVTEKKITNHFPDSIMLEDSIGLSTGAWEMLSDPTIDVEEDDSMYERCRRALVFVPDGFFKDVPPETVYIEEIDAEGTWLRLVNKEDIDTNHIVHEVEFQRYYTLYWHRKYDKDFGMNSIYVIILGMDDAFLAVKPDHISM